jgi:beta-glucosidase
MSSIFCISSRRLFAPLPAFFVITALLGCVTAPRAPKITEQQAQKARSLDTGPFWWGTSTASYQNEDRAVRPGDLMYFETDWDVFSREEKGAPIRGDDATFSWTHFDNDVALLKKIGVTHFRFSIEWARVEPQPGVWNEAAIGQYAEMARKLRAAGIEPVVTLWHFTFPDWLYTKTSRKPNVNFLHPDLAEAWKRYVRRMALALAPHVRVFIPQNEPNGAVQLGWLGAHWPPGLLLRTFSYKRALAAAVRDFRVAAQIVRKVRPDALIMSVHSLPVWRRNYLKDPTAAAYNTMMRQNFDHLDAVYDVCDIIGINYYYSQDADILDFIFRGQGEMGPNYTQMGWKIDPKGIYDIVKQVGLRYQKPMVIVENGFGTQNELKRVKYVRDHINQIRRALADGYDVRGYFAWTLVDNYEWTEGFVPKFGLSRMDPETKQRILEPSGEFFAQVIKTYGNLRKDYCAGSVQRKK